MRSRRDPVTVIGDETREKPLPDSGRAGRQVVGLRPRLASPFRRISAAGHGPDRTLSRRIPLQKPPQARATAASPHPQLPLLLALGVTAIFGFTTGPLSTLLGQAASLLVNAQ